MRLYHTLANNELFHICAESAETGDDGPLLEDVISLIKEAVLDFEDILSVDECTPPERRHRTLREARVQHATATTSHAAARFVEDNRGRRALRKTHPTAHKHVAPRARHLRYNHFTRPARCRMQGTCYNRELLDGFSIIGGYDGTQIFLKLKIDVSKQDMMDIRGAITQPLQFLTNADFLLDLNLSDHGSAIVNSIFDNIDADVSFSAGAHLGATGEQINNVFCYEIPSYIDQICIFLCLINPK